MRLSGEERASALWGSGSGRGNENGLRGRLARVVAGPVLALAVVTPLAAGAAQQSLSGRADYVAPWLIAEARENPQATLPVIVRSTDGMSTARKVVGDLPGDDRRLPIVDAVATEITGSDLTQLEHTSGLVVTPDAPVVLDSSSKQLWPYAVGADRLWRSTEEVSRHASERRGGANPAIAIVDSGIQSRADFGGKKGRILRQVTMTTLTPNSPGDGRGHGTFVAGIAAGDASRYAGAAPSANLVSLDVMDDHGMARTSDVIAAANWILVHKDDYDIRVANFSLHSANASSFTRDPLDKAVERLWLAGVVVVTSSGNNGSASGASGVGYAPGNDPFVLTVGALDLNGSLRPRDHTIAPWSAYGYTNDGFAKPEVVAPGRYMVGPVPTDSTLALERPGQLVDHDYIQLSGTSFSAAVVSGVAADLTALHPAWRPDDVKGALMLTARALPRALPLSAGVGEVYAPAAAALAAPPNPNLALERFLVPDPDGGSVPVFDAVSWSEAARSSVSWDQASWAFAAWSSAAWSVGYWADVSWNQVSYDDVSYDDVSYDDVSYDDVSYEDAALSDFLPGGYPLAGAFSAP